MGQTPGKRRSAIYIKTLVFDDDIFDLAAHDQGYLHLCTRLLYARSQKRKGKERPRNIIDHKRVKVLWISLDGYLCFLGFTSTLHRYGQRDKPKISVHITMV